MMKTFLCEYIHPEARRKLEDVSEIISDWERLPECDAIINRNLQLTAEILRKASSLKVIAVHGTGLDGVDLETAGQMGIQVFNTPYRNAASVAELNIALMLAAARKFSLVQKQLAEGVSFADSAVMSALQGMELGGKTVAFLGVGEIAKKTITICRHGFEMHCIGWSRSLTEEKASKLGINYAGSIVEAVSSADFVVLGMALNAETRGIIGEKELSAMKPGAVLVNTARGALLDEAALYTALTSPDGPLMAAALDVVTEEPVNRENPLYQLPNVILTPHIGANTDEALYRVGMACVEGILERI
ncbi:MAG: 3-phosphoglycerate dehydrogenase [Lachnospiraceae bacterium]|nr:3-phosphoglycerate dehydrogenase [Lachnospiraceae bacterium]